MMIATRAEPCVHCGEPCGPNDDSATGADHLSFCCSGCRAAYELIHGWGLDDYYALRDQQINGPIVTTSSEDSRYEAFNDDAFLGRSAPKGTADGLLSAELAIHGLHCAACVWLIENAAARTVGWTMARVKMVDHTIRVLFDPNQVQLSQIARLLGRLGYEITPLTGDKQGQFRQENRRLLVQIAIAGFCAANAMWIAIALYAGEASGVSASHSYFLRLFGTGLGLVAVLFPGRTFFAGALASLRTRTPHMDLPVALGLSVGTIVGTANAIAGTGDVYFDSLAVLVFLLLIGRWIQFRQQHRAAKSVDLLLRITPRHANLRNAEGRFDLVLAETLRPDDVIRVAAGESIPTDGVVEAGESLIDRSLLTGESKPVSAIVGDEVCAGTVNLRQPIEVRVEAVGADSRVGRVMKSVEDAMAEKTPIVQLADRVGGVFVVVVTLLAGITFTWWLGRGPTLAASHATALLIVACPCALALATPLAIAVSLGRAAKQKILIRDGSTFQRLARPGRIWFDKTGTLTQGKVTAEYVAGDASAIGLAAAIERDCNHPIADAIVRLAGDSVSDSTAAETEVSFGGVIGRLDGHQIAVGNSEFLASLNCSIAAQLERLANEVSVSGWSPILIAVDEIVVAVLKVSDPLRPHAQTTVAQLQRQGWKVGLLSGDIAETVNNVARQVGIEAQNVGADLSPEQKLEIVRRDSDETIVMVGDGANDAAALAAADVGIAVRGGAEVSLQAAPVFISSGDLFSINQLMCGSRRTMWLIGTAFAVSLSYNLVAVALAMMGLITPLIAAILMPISSVSVLSMTLAWPVFQKSQS